MSTKSQPPEVTLRLWAEHLDGITEQRAGQPFRDVLADGLIWPDETIDSTPFDVISSLRFVWHHRTGIIIDEQRRFGDICFHIGLDFIQTVVARLLSWRTCTPVTRPRKEV